MEPVIKLENVNFYYDFGKITQFEALKNINLEIFPQDFVGILGPSGCGKSTLLHLLAGIEKPQTGKVIVSGKNLVETPVEDLALFRQIGVGIIFQSFNLIPSINVLDNVTLPMAFIGISLKKRKEKGMALLKMLGIGELAHRYPVELSGGQQQRVGIARALANDPPIILADEPIGNLDSTNAQIVLNILKTINKTKKKTIIMVTHQAWTLKGTVNRIFYMRDGKIIKAEEVVPRIQREIKRVGTSYYYQQLFPKVPRPEVYAQMLAHLILRGHNRAEIERFKEFLKQRLTNKIDKITFEELLDRPFQEGGLGLWRQKAKKVADYVEEIMKERKNLRRLLKKIEKYPTEPFFEEINKIQNWLLKDYQLQLSNFQKERFREVLGNRIRNIILPEHFLEVLDLPLEKGGIGLRIDTALKISQRLELFLGK